MNWLLGRILIRWLANSFGLWIAARLIPDIVFDGGIEVIILAGLVLSIINTILKPLIVILSLPAIVLTLGLFMVFINGLMVYIAAGLMDSLDIEGYGAAVLAGLIIGLVNYAVTAILESKGSKSNG